MKIFIVAAIFIAGSLAQSEYCKICSNHVACLNQNGAWAPTCPRDAALAQISSAELSALFVDEHNNYRNQVASGQINNLAASNMKKLVSSSSTSKNSPRLYTLSFTLKVWNSEMATLASLNVKQCAMRHDGCRNLKDGQYSGQNLYWSGYQGSGIPDIKTQIKNSVASWFSEYKDTNQENIRNFGSSPSNKVIGHFTQLAWATNAQIGCAVATYSGDPWKSVLIACNYGDGNWRGESVYLIGNAASQCRTRDSKYPFLCTS